MIDRSRRFISATLLTGVFCAVTGCVSYEAIPLDPHQELESLAARSLDDFKVERALPGSVAQGFKFDLSDGLNEAEVVAVALTLNPELRAKRLEIGEAEALLITAGLWPNPEIGVGLTWGIAGAPGYSVDADLLFELLRPGERSARRAAAEAAVTEVNADIVAEEYRTVAEVRERRLAVLAAEQGAALLEQEVELREKTLQFVKQRKQLGEGTELDVSAAELEAVEARRDLRKARTEMEAQRRELNRVLGLPTEYRLLLSESGKPLAVTVYEELTDAELDRHILAGRLELRAKEAGYRRTEHELRLAILGQYPQLKIGPAFQHELEGDNALGLGASVELPLFDRNQGEIHEKKTRRDRVRAEYAAMLHRLRSDAHSARADLRRAKLEIEAQEKDLLPLIKRNQELVDGALKARELSILDWITAQQRVLRGRREFQESLVQYRIALLRLEAALGQALNQPPPSAKEPSAPGK